ncbi:uncharacterized protein LOC106673122 [Cimex lectularius]|uniref:Uncharacterized protein n=1 Tax=Cimex lectularius TaxID=79782 RepID=A0A8I6SGM7_CIMLE|nr:uncharacterized protein LOC106673122 [Cimex lectularius]
MELGIKLYLRIAEVTLSIVLLMYQLGKELDIQELASENEMRIVSTTYTSMIIPLLFRLELSMFEREEFSKFIDLLVIALGITSYSVACVYTLYIFYSHSEEDWRSYDSEEKYFKIHVYIKATIAVLLCFVLITDFVTTFWKHNTETK